MIKSLAHACFVVKDLDRALAFYQGKLGLKPAFDFINDKGVKFGVYLHVGQRSFVELFVGDPDAPSPKASYKHICLEVDSVAKTMEDLKSKGVDVTGYMLGSDHSWQAWIVDPDGNRIELHEYTPESKQAPHLR